VLTEPQSNMESIFDGNVRTIFAASAPRLSPSRRAATGASLALDGHSSSCFAVAAYFRAERRGFAHGGELADWLAAERDVDHQMSGANEWRK
jgi:hypothetical protein